MAPFSFGSMLLDRFHDLRENAATEALRQPLDVTVSICDITMT